MAVASGIWNYEFPFNNPAYNNDYVILKLASPLNFNENVQPACLPDPNFAPDVTGQMCFVSGWGALTHGGSRPDILQWVDVPMITNDQCSQSYNSYTFTDTLICAGYPEGGKDACNGDSGSPLVCENNGKAVFVGSVSWGNGCALPNYPGVYARVATVLPWIQDNMVNN